ncbi:DNA repair protein RecO [Thiovibrio sp. JS02]
MPQQRNLAVVLQVKDHGDSDKIVILYTREQGKIAAIAKGAKRSKKRFVNKLEPFSLLATHLAPSRTSSLMRLDEADLLAPYPILRESYPQYIAASLLCELVLHWTREHDSDEELFDLLTWALEGLAAGGDGPRTVIFFHIRMLDILGYRPFLSGCLDCGSLAAGNGPYRFSPLRNGLVCSRCEPPFSASSLPISIQTVQLLRRAQDLTQGKLERLRFSQGALTEALALLKRYDSHLLQRELQSWNFLC